MKTNNGIRNQNSEFTRAQGSGGERIIAERTKRQAAVAQIFNLLYRRISFGKARSSQGQFFRRAVGKWQSRETLTAASRLCDFSPWRLGVKNLPLVLGVNSTFCILHSAFPL
jgi:hypothetical protein